MKFASFAIAALLSVASARNNLANQLTSLKGMVQATGEWDTNNMIDVISARKIELEAAFEAGTMSKAEVQGELRYLLQLVRDVESNNKAHAVETLTTRKSALVSLAAEGEGDDDDDADADTEVSLEDAEAALTAAEEARDAAQEALDLAQETLDAANEAVDGDDETTEDDEAVVAAQGVVDAAQEDLDAKQALVDSA